MEKFKSEKEILEDSLKNETILRGTITAITKKLDVKVRKNDAEEHYKLVIRKGEDTLYIPNKIRENSDSAISKYMMMYYGSDIPFVVTDIKCDENGELQEVKASMKKAKEVELKRINEEGVENLPKVIPANIIGATDQFAVIEYRGQIQSIPASSISYSEIDSVKEYIKRNKITKFDLLEFTNNVGVLRVSCREYVPDMFKKRVLEKHEFEKGDCVFATIIKRSQDGYLLLKIDEDILASAKLEKGNQIRNNEYKINDKVNCVITNVIADKRKLHVILR